MHAQGREGGGGVISFDEATGFPVSGHACTDPWKRIDHVLCRTEYGTGLPSADRAASQFREPRSIILNGGDVTKLRTTKELADYRT